MSIMTILFTMASSAYAQEMPLGQLPSDVRPTHYRLDLEIFPKQDRFFGYVEIDVELSKPTNLIWLHGYRLDVTNAYILTSDEKKVTATYVEDEENAVAKLMTEQIIPPGKITLKLKYSAPFQEDFKGMYNVHKGNKSFAFTQFQASRARSVFPGFDERCALPSTATFVRNNMLSNERNRYGSFIHPTEYYRTPQN